MTIAFTVLALVVAAYRVKRRLFTKAEWVLLAVWLLHFGFELLVMFGEYMRFRFQIRFFAPVDFLTWFWLAWGIVELWRRQPRFKWAMLSALALILVYDGVMLTRAQIPFSRRYAYSRACEWAAEEIRKDWQGPARDAESIFILGEYRIPNRPVINCHSARVAYLCNGRSDGIDDGADGDSRIAELDRPDYWIQDLRQDDPPKGDDWELMGTYRRGKYELPLYRRKR